MQFHGNIKPQKTALPASIVANVEKSVSREADFALDLGGGLELERKPEPRRRITLWIVSIFTVFSRVYSLE
jgi:hypothetical protein